MLLETFSINSGPVAQKITRNSTSPIYSHRYITTLTPPLLQGSYHALIKGPTANADVIS